MGMKAKILLTLLATLVVLFPTNGPAADYEQAYASLLSKYVEPSGVRYGTWHSRENDLQLIREVTEAIGEASMPADRNERLAFLINAYNAWMARTVLENWPIDSITDIEGFGIFKKKFLKVAGKTMSFDELEKQTIMPQFKDPRAHFAINCAAVSCPPLHEEPYVGAKLDQQLDLVTTRFLEENPWGVEISKDGSSVRVSKLFDWYRKDFQQAGGVIPFINQYRKIKIPENTRLQFIDYDWALNSAG